MIEILTIVSIIAALLFGFLFFKKKNKENQNLRAYEEEKARLEQDILLKKQEDILLEEKKSEKEKIIAEALARELEQATNRISTFYEEGVSKAQLELKLYQQDIDIEKERWSKKLQSFQQEVDQSISEKKSIFESETSKIDNDLEDRKKLYQSVVKAIIEAEEKENSLFYRIIVPRKEQEDILVLEEKVLPLLNSPDPIRKLVWTLYVQKPLNELLDRILPGKEVSGIYKITNLKNKKSYIGRSVNVRNRLQEHVKSSIGIGNIADQKIHEVMREEGVWSFTFELLEQAEKDQLSSREKYYIKFFETDGICGYNQTVGG